MPPSASGNAIPVPPDVPLVITEGKDFSSALYTADGRLVAQGDQDLPGQIGAMQFAMQSTIEYIGRDNFAPGDVVITNDPTLTGTHLQDVKMLSPVFHRGELIALQPPLWPQLVRFGEPGWLRQAAGDGRWKDHAGMVS